MPTASLHQPANGVSVWFTDGSQERCDLEMPSADDLEVPSANMFYMFSAESATKVKGRWCRQPDPPVNATLLRTLTVLFELLSKSC